MSTLPTVLLAQASLAGVLAGLALWWFGGGARRWSRRRSLRQALARTGAGPAADAQGAPALHEAFAQVRQALQGAEPVRGRRDALYRSPWILFLGDPASRVPDLLRAGVATSPPVGSVPGAFWRWWLAPRMVAIECDPAVLEEAAAAPVRAHWYAALLALADKRAALPLDGIALCVDARSLLAGTAQAQALAARLRLRADEASQQLRLRLLAQVLVTGLDQLPGYAVLCRALGPEVLAQAVGFRVPVASAIVIDEVLDELSARWRALRMALLRAQHDAPGRFAVHAFFEAMLALQPGLQAFLLQLFPPDHRAPYRLRGRGLYFVAAPAPPAGALPAAFVADLFTRFLPAERAFARPRR